MKEYKIGFFWKVFVCIAGLLFIGVFAFLLCLPFLPGLENEIKADAYNYGIMPLSIVIITVVVIGILDFIIGKFSIDNRKITSISAFSKKEIVLTEIKGYRITDKFVFIIPKKEDQKTIKIATQTAKIDEIKNWLKNHYPNLDVQEFENERNEILNNPEFGWSKKNREEALQRASKTAKNINWAGGIIALWTFLYPKPYSVAVICCILFPIICLIVLKYFKGLIRIDTKKNLGYPSVFSGLFFPSMAIGVRSLLDFYIYDYSNIWLPMVIIGLCYISLYAIGNPEFKLGKLKDTFSIIGFAFIVFAYSYGIVVSLNCILDTSKPTQYTSKVLSKRASSGKNDTNHLKLAPWGNQTDANEVSVTKEEYESYNENDPVNIYLMKGKFEIPWFKISQTSL